MLNIDQISIFLSVFVFFTGKTKNADTASGRICNPHHFCQKTQVICFCFASPRPFFPMVCPFRTGSSYRTVQSPITPPFLTAQRSNRTAYCLFTRQDLPQKIPSLQIQFCGRKSCKICKKIFYFFTFVGMYKTAILFLCNFHRNIRKKIWFFLKKAFSFSFFYGILLIVG